MIPKSVKQFSEKIMPNKRRSDGPDSTKLNQTLAGESVERCRIVDQDAMAHGVVRCPIGQQIEQHRIVRLVGFGRMRPVAAPYDTFWRGCNIRARNRQRL